MVLLLQKMGSVIYIINPPHFFRVYHFIFCSMNQMQKYEENFILQKYFVESRKVRNFASSFNRQKDREKARFLLFRG